MADTTLGFVELLDLEVIEANIFRGRSSPGEPMRVFGGQVAAQALIAAGRTVPSERRVHSLHAYFLRPGDSGAPIVYEVDRIRDGRSFTTRRVIAIQHGEVIFNLAASFQRAEEGLSHQASTMPDVPGPDETPTMAERLAPYAEVAHEFNGWFERSLAPRPIEVRYVEIPPTLVPRSGPQEPRQALWVRAVRPFPDDPLYHACAVTYASDLSLISTTLRPHGLASASAGIATASLDHAVWFHRPFRADEWLLYVQESPTGAGSRGFARGQIFTADGTLVVSTVQEALTRRID